MHAPGHMQTHQTQTCMHHKQVEMGAKQNKLVRTHTFLYWTGPAVSFVHLDGRVSVMKYKVAGSGRTINLLCVCTDAILSLKSFT